MDSWWKEAEVNHQEILDQNAGTHLEGLPGAVNVPGYGQLQFGAHGELQGLSDEYKQNSGIGDERPSDYLKVDPDTAAQIAQEYEGLEHNPDDPEVQASYNAMIQETLEQYNHLLENGYTFEFYPIGYDPYPNSPREAVLDLHNNKHMYVYPTDAGFGSSEEEEYPNHPLLGDSGLVWNQPQADGSVIEKPVTYNDLFRAVHDVYGHAKEGVGFRADGEDNAYRQHSSMYSPLARGAMAAETRGQNSWVNFGPHGESNQTASTEDTVFAPQKATILPEWAQDPNLHAPTVSHTYSWWQGDNMNWWNTKIADPRFEENNQGMYDLVMDEGDNPSDWKPQDFRVGSEVIHLPTGQEGHIEETLDVDLYNVLLDDGEMVQATPKELELNDIDHDGDTQIDPSDIHRFTGDDPEAQNFEDPTFSLNGYIDDDVDHLQIGDKVRCLLTEEGRGQDEFIDQMGTIVATEGNMYTVEVEGLGTTDFDRKSIELMPTDFNPHYGGEKLGWWKESAPVDEQTSLFGEEELETIETSPYLQKINMDYLEKNWPMETLVANILDAYANSTEEEYTAGIEWYNKVHNIAKDFADKYGYSFEVVCAVFARLSPNLYWDTNYVQAIAFIEAHANGTASTWEDVRIWTPYSYEGKPCGYGTNNNLAWQILETGDTSLVRGEKIESFMHNFMMGPEDPDTKATVDIWATRVAFKDPLVEPAINDTDGSYAYLEQAYNLAAQEAGLTPKQIQAVTWVHYKNKYGRNRGPTDYVDRFNDWIETPMEERQPPNPDDLALRPGEKGKESPTLFASWWHDDDLDFENEADPEEQEREAYESRVYKGIEGQERSAVYAAILEAGGLQTRDDLREEYRAIPNTYKRRDGLTGDQMAEYLSTNYPEFGIENENDLINILSGYSNRFAWWTGAAAGSNNEAMYHIIEAMEFLENEGNDVVVSYLRDALSNLEHDSTLEASWWKGGSVNQFVRIANDVDGNPINKGGVITGEGVDPLAGEVLIVNVMGQEVYVSPADVGERVELHDALPSPEGAYKFFSTSDSTKFWDDAAATSHPEVIFSAESDIDEDDPLFFYGTYKGPDYVEIFSDEDLSDLAIRKIESMFGMVGNATWNNEQIPLGNVVTSMWWRGNGYDKSWWKGAAGLGDNAEWLIQQVGAGVIPYEDAHQQISDMKLSLEDPKEIFELDTRLKLLEQMEKNPMPSQGVTPDLSYSQTPAQESEDAPLPRAQWWDA
jgi:hypothetical protein